MSHALLIEKQDKQPQGEEEHFEILVSPEEVQTEEEQGEDEVHRRSEGTAMMDCFGDGHVLLMYTPLLLLIITELLEVFLPTYTIPLRVNQALRGLALISVSFVVVLAYMSFVFQRYGSRFPRLRQMTLCFIFAMFLALFYLVLFDYNRLCKGKNKNNFICW